MTLRFLGGVLALSASWAVSASADPAPLLLPPQEVISASGETVGGRGGAQTTGWGHAGSQPPAGNRSIDQFPVRGASSSAGSPMPDVSFERTGSVGEPSAADAHGSAEPPAPEPEASDEGAHHGQEAHAEPSSTRSPMPFDVIRTLQFLQDQIARGNGRAIRVQAALLRRFGPTFASADPAVWNDERNRRAAVLFALSGGPPDVLKRLIAEGRSGEAMKPVFQGALAYVENDLKRAETSLSSIDLDAIEPGLVAHLSLVLGQLQQNAHPAEAVVHLDRARLLAPGGLIEEAALRLEIVLVDKLGEHDRADRLAREYFSRYANSSYAGNFRARFAMVYADRGAENGSAALATIVDITSGLSPDDRRSLLLAIGRRALIDGHLEFAHLASAEALKSDGTVDEDLQRGNLYAAAAALGGPSGSQAAVELQGIDRSKLHPADAELLDAANSVLSGIDAALPDEPTDTHAADNDASPVFDRAQRLLDAVAGDLKEQQ